MNLSVANPDRMSNLTDFQPEGIGPCVTAAVCACCAICLEHPPRIRLPVRLRPHPPHIRAACGSPRLARRWPPLPNPVPVRGGRSVRGTARDQALASAQSDRFGASLPWRHSSPARPARLRPVTSAALLPAHAPPVTISSTLFWTVLPHGRVTPAAWRAGRSSRRHGGDRPGDAPSPVCRCGRSRARQPRLTARRPWHRARPKRSRRRSNARHRLRLGRRSRMPRSSWRRLRPRAPRPMPTIPGLRVLRRGTHFRFHSAMVCSDCATIRACRRRPAEARLSGLSPS